MKRSYDFIRLIGCRVPAPSVGFCEGGWMGFARQFPGKGTNGDETRRSRKTASADADAVGVGGQGSGVWASTVLTTGLPSSAELALATTAPQPRAPRPQTPDPRPHARRASCPR